MPIEFIEKNTIKKEGIRIPHPAIMVILKQEVEMNRSYSVEGQKDRIDILNIIINSEFNWEKYFDTIKKFKLHNYRKRLKQIISQSRDEFNYLGI